MKVLRIGDMSGDSQRPDQPVSLPMSNDAFALLGVVGLALIVHFSTRIS